MQAPIRFAALVAGAILSTTALAQAQSANVGGGQVGPSGVIMSPSASPAPASPAVTTGTGGASQAGAPGSSPGRIGTGAAPSGLAGDNPSAPGFPGKVGR